MLLLRRDYYYQCLTYCGTFESSAMILIQNKLEFNTGSPRREIEYWGQWYLYNVKHIKNGLKSSFVVLENTLGKQFAGIEFKERGA